MDADRYRAALATGDVLGIALVLSWGIVDHHGLAGLLDPGRVVGAVAPFVVGYVAVALLAGTYERVRIATLAWSLRTVTATWLGALGVGLVIRSSPAVVGGASWPFGLVLIVFGLPVLLAWRLGAHVAFSAPE